LERKKERKNNEAVSLADRPGEIQPIITRLRDENLTYIFIANYFLRVIPVILVVKDGYDGPARSTRDSMRVTNGDR
jgi:hypothetical protein